MQFSSYGNWVKPIPHLLNRFGADGHALLAELGIERQASGRIPVEKTALAWRRAAETIGEPAIGLLAAEAAQPASWGELGLAIMCSESLGHAIALLLKYPAFISDSVHIATRVEGDAFILDVTPATPELPGIESLEFGMATGFQLLRAIYPGQLTLRSLTLTRDESTDLGPYRRFYGCDDVQTGSPIARQVYALHDTQVALPFANEALVRHHESLLQQQLQQQLTQPHSPDLERLILNAIGLQMATGAVDQGAIARQLNMSARHLQRKLKARQLRFTDMVDQVRRDHALNLLRDGRRSLTEVAHLLGFSDHSNFTRAFKRWFGQTPTQYLA